jgi:choline dehydrogenase-like flavoprotein
MIVLGRDLAAGFECSADVCIVGSGTGGAVVAKELAESGLSVVVLEEGGHYAPEDYGRFSFAETRRRMMRNGGVSMAVGIGDSPTVQVATGRVVGGGSVLTGGVCFRVPDRILEEWVADGLDEFAPKRMEPMFKHVERESFIQETNVSLQSSSTRLFVDGAAKLGVNMKPMRRNMNGCRGAGRCTTGCPYAAKKSVDLTFLRKARSHGTTIYSDCLVEKIVTRGGRAVGVKGKVLGGPYGKPGHSFTVHARTVVIAAGALHTPLLLRASGIGKQSGAVGKNLTLHPGFGLGAIAPERIEGWRGGMQTAYADNFTSQGIVMVSLFGDPSLMASRAPGVGASHLDFARKLPNMALFGGIIRDVGRGTVRPGPGREPVIPDRMAPSDKAAFVRAMCLLGEMALEGGAKEIVLPVRGLQPMREVRELRELALRPPHASRFQAISFHPLCTARMGLSPSHDVVSQSGETYEVKNLFIADGSAFRSSLGVNAQVSIMAAATRIAWGLRDNWSQRARAAI